MFKNKLFLKIAIIFTFPVLYILGFSSVLVFEKIKLMDEVENNKNSLIYIKIVDKLVSYLEKEQDLSLKYISSQITIDELNKQQELTKSALDELKKYITEEKDRFQNNTLDLNELFLFRDQISKSKIDSKEISKYFNQSIKGLVDSLFVIKFKKLSNDFEINLSQIYNFLDSNENIDGISKLFVHTLEQLKIELGSFEKDANFQTNITIAYLLVSFLVLVLLFFVLKNIISSEQKSFRKIEKHKQVYEILDSTNKFLLKIHDKEDFYANICELLGENECFNFCFFYDNRTKKIIASNQELENMIISEAGELYDFSKNEILSKNIKYETNIIINNFKEKNLSIFYKDAEKLNINSLGTFPIKKFNETIGVLIIYSREFEFFDKEVEVLFDKLVSDITRCLEKIYYEKARLEQESESRLYSYAFESSAPMIITDFKNTIIKVNQAFCRLMGYSKDEIIGNDPRMFKAPNQSTEHAKNLWNSLKINGIWSGDVYDKRANDEMVALKATITAIRDKDNKVTNYLGQYMDNSDQKDKEKVLEHQATHDNLTGLPNRLLLTDRADHAIKKAVRNKIFGGMIFIDLDNFKVVNDTLGHDIGDVLLITVSQKIEQAIREEDTVARLGGDEFIVLLDNVGNNDEEAKNNIMDIAQKIKTNLNTITHIKGHENPSTASIGVTLFSDSTVSVQDIIKQADDAMYKAKNSGKNRVEFF